MILLLQRPTINHLPTPIIFIINNFLLIGTDNKIEMND